MAQTSGFFEAQEVAGVYDREYFASQFADYFKLFVKNGVFGSPTNQLKVTAGTGLHVKVAIGWAFIDGTWYHNDSELDLTISPNVGAVARTDGIFVRYTISDRVTHTISIESTTGVIRDGEYYDLKLAEVSVPVGATGISNANITDFRTDQTVCGFVTQLLEVQTTEDLFTQYNAQFTEWFNGIKGQLGSDAATALLALIDSLRDDFETYQATNDAALNARAILTYKNVAALGLDLTATLQQIVNAMPSEGAELFETAYRFSNITFPTSGDYTIHIIKQISTMVIVKLYPVGASTSSYFMKSDGAGVLTGIWIRDLSSEDVKPITITLAPNVGVSAWIAMTGGYYQDVDAAGYLVGDEPLASFVPATPPFPTVAEESACSYIKNKTCIIAGKIRFYATAYSTIALTYKLRGRW